MHLDCAPHDNPHVIALFRRGRAWGALSKSNGAWLRYREPVYRTLRELAMSYFHEFFDKRGHKTLRSYSAAFDLRRTRPGAVGHQRASRAGPCTIAWRPAPLPAARRRRRRAPCRGAIPSSGARRGLSSTRPPRRSAREIAPFGPRASVRRRAPGPVGRSRRRRHRARRRARSPRAAGRARLGPAARAARPRPRGRTWPRSTTTSTCPARRGRSSGRGRSPAASRARPMSSISRRSSPASTISARWSTSGRSAPDGMQTTQVQAAALMMSANNALSHAPPMSWLCLLGEARPAPPTPTSRSGAEGGSKPSTCTWTTSARAMRPSGTAVDPVSAARVDGHGRLTGGNHAAASRATRSTSSARRTRDPPRPTASRGRPRAGCLTRTCRRSPTAGRCRIRAPISPARRSTMSGPAGGDPGHHRADRQRLRRQHDRVPARPGSITRSRPRTRRTRHR